jgi:hypothetical protein
MLNEMAKLLGGAKGAQQQLDSCILLLQPLKGTEELTKAMKRVDDNPRVQHGTRHERMRLPWQGFDGGKRSLKPRVGQIGQLDRVANSIELLNDSSWKIAGNTEKR